MTDILIDLTKKRRYKVNRCHYCNHDKYRLRNNWRELDYDEYMAKVKPKHSHLIGLAKYPKQFKSTGIKTLVARALHILYVQRRIIYIIGNRQILSRHMD
jgi:hypothetical protein